MGCGAAALVVAGLLTGRVAVLSSFGTAQWIAGIYLGVGGGALAFILWVMALQRATPTRVANTMTVNPIAAALLANQLVGEPITLNLVVGLVELPESVRGADRVRHSVKARPGRQRSQGALNALR